MRKTFDMEMQSLHELMIKMGALCEAAIDYAMKALFSGEKEDAIHAAELEVEINQMERDIEQLCYKLLLRQQPVARDLRQISATLKMITDMERIGDQAADIAELSVLGNVVEFEKNTAIKEMSCCAKNMVVESIDAYVNHDLSLAFSIMEEDDKVDAYFDQIKHELVSLLLTNPASAEGVVDLLMVAKYLERIGDHAVNISEWVVFIVTGEYHKENEQGALYHDYLSGRR
ncbi:MAG: phosphate signaling complex protein PhoU [Clostridiales bacterium]|nr:phosphate signaling complex protein PhoU [Clostridiales bacterium]